MNRRDQPNSTPLHQAVMEGNLEQVIQLKDSEWRLHQDSQGFTPLELAQLLGRSHCQEVLSPNSQQAIIKVQLKDQKIATAFTIAEFEEIFDLTYRSFLTFPSYQVLTDVIRNCPYLLRLEWLMISKDEKEAFYQSELANGATANTFVKWMNPTLGYGLFAATDLAQHAFIGEYTGLVRQIERAHPDLNPYCFHYPTRFWSFKYFVIDALHQGNLLRFINHSDRPNLQPLWLVKRGILHLILVANCLISKGTELTFNYGSDYWIRRKKLVLSKADYC